MNRLIATAAVFGLLCASHSEAQTWAYSINSDGGSTGPAGAVGDELYRINLENGEAQRIGAVGAEDVEGLAFDDAGVLYGVDDARKTTLTINLSNARGSAIGGVLGNTRLATGEAQDPSLAQLCSGELVGVAKNTRTLYRVNTSNGGFDARGGAGATTGKITDLATRGGVLYGLGEDALYRIDAQTGSAMALGEYGAGINFLDGGGLAVDKLGQLWAVAERRASNGDVVNSQIYRINHVSGVATPVATTIPGLESLAINESTCALQQVASQPVPGLNYVGFALMLLGLLLIGRRFS
jgi:hypothetical protein